MTPSAFWITVSSRTQITGTFTYWNGQSSLKISSQRINNPYDLSKIHPILAFQPIPELLQVDAQQRSGTFQLPQADFHTMNASNGIYQVVPFVDDHHMASETHSQRLSCTPLEKQRVRQCDYFRRFDSCSGGVVRTDVELFSQRAHILDVTDGGKSMVSEVIDECLVFSVWKKGAFVFLRCAWLLEFETSFVDGGQGVEFVDCRVYAEILA